MRQTIAKSLKKASRGKVKVYKALKKKWKSMSKPEKEAMMRKGV